MYVLSHVRLFVTPWTVAHQSPLSMEFSRQEYWNGLLFPTPRDLPKPGIKPVPPALAGGFFYHCAPWGAPDTLRQIQRSRAFYHVINCVIKSFLPAMCPPNPQRLPASVSPQT